MIKKCSITIILLFVITIAGCCDDDDDDDESTTHKEEYAITFDTMMPAILEDGDVPWTFVIKKDLSASLVAYNDGSTRFEIRGVDVEDAGNKVEFLLVGNPVVKEYFPDDFTIGIWFLGTMFYADDDFVIGLTKVGKVGEHIEGYFYGHVKTDSGFRKRIFDGVIKIKRDDDIVIKK